MASSKKPLFRSQSVLPSPIIISFDPIPESDPIFPKRKSPLYSIVPQQQQQLQQHSQQLSKASKSKSWPQLPDVRQQSETSVLQRSFSTPHYKKPFVPMKPILENEEEGERGS